MRLSKITETKKGRMALFGEADEFLFSVDAETYYKYGLCEGCELDAAALAGLQAASETRRAKDKALGYLAPVSYTHLQINGIYSKKMRLPALGARGSIS